MLAGVKADGEVAAQPDGGDDALIGEDGVRAPLAPRAPELRLAPKMSEPACTGSSRGGDSQYQSTTGEVVERKSRHR